MSGDEFQTRYLTVIDTMLTSAAAETTKLFETMVSELKEELSKIKKENEDLKSKCSYLELLTNQPKPDIHGIDSENGPGTSATCDIGVQCGNMLCHFERVEESELESPPREEQSQKISQQVLRVDKTMANEDNVTMQTSLNSEVISEHPIRLSDEVSFSMKGASCDSEIDLKEIGVDFQTKSSAQINKRRSPLKQRVKGKVPSPPINLDIRNCSSIISAATSRRGRPPKKASLSELRTQPEPQTSPVMGRPCRMPRCCVTQLPLQGTISPPPFSDILRAKKASETPSKHVKLDPSSCVPCLAASLTGGHFSEDAEHSGLHQVYKEMEENSVPSAADSLEHPLSELPKSKYIGPRKLSHNPKLHEALLHVEAINPQISTLDAFEKSSSLPKMTVPAQTQNTSGFTSSNAPLTPSVSLSPASPQTTTTDNTSDPSTVVCQMSNSLPTLDQSTKIHSVLQLPLGTRNSDVSASTPSAVVTSKTLLNSPTKLKQHRVLKSNTASGATFTRAQSRLQHSFTSISPVEASNDRLGNSNSKNVSETKFASPQTMMQGKSSNLPDISECAEENASYLKTKNMCPCVVNCGQKDLPTTLAKVQPSRVALTRSTLAELCSVSKTLPISSLSSSSSNKESPNESVDCVVAETATHNTKRRIQKGYRKQLKEAGPSHGTETTSKPREVIPKVANLDTDEYSPDNARKLTQKPDAVSPKYNANKQIPCGLKGFRLMTNKLSPSAKKRRLSQEKARPKESVGLVNNAITLTRIKTEAVWVPPILKASKSPLGNDNCCDQTSTKRTTRYSTPKQRTGSRLVTRKHRPPFTPFVSSSNGSTTAPRTVRYSRRGTTHPTAAKTSPVQSPSEPFSVNRECLLRNQCEQCGRVLSSKAALQRHVSLHSGQKPFSCTLCSQSFPDSKALSRHGSVHRNGKIYVCPQCNEGFAYRFGLTQHLQMVHSRIKPFVCHICQKSYFRRKDVETHLRVHTGAKQFPCNLCDKRFNRRVELDVHLRSHSREKRHWCPHCGKEFLDYNNLKRHKYTHTGERPYSCPHCTKSFVQSGHLKKHLRNVHKVDVYADSQ
ncbi:unnamed protein product [Lota lota]